MSDVFIAHVEEDAEVALEIALALEQAGYTTWCYEVDSIPGPSYLIQTGQAVEQSKAVVLVVSPHSVGSRQVTKEVIRAHESGKEFIPLLRGITHIEFQNRQPEWREAVGAAASISVPLEGVAGILPRIVDGLKALGILPRLKAETAHIARIRRALDELRGRGIPEKGRELPVPTRKPEPEAIAAEIPTAKVAEEARGRQRWIRLALIASAIIALSVVGVIFLTQPEPPPPTAPETEPKPTPSPTQTEFQLTEWSVIDDEGTAALQALITAGDAINLILTDPDGIDKDSCEQCLSEVKLKLASKGETPKAGRYTLLVKDVWGNEITTQTFDFEGAKLAISGISLGWGQFLVDGLCLRRIEFTVTNRGDIPAYISTGKIDIGGREGSVSLNRVVLPDSEKLISQSKAQYEMGGYVTKVPGGEKTLTLKLKDSAGEVLYTYSETVTVG